VNPIEYPPQQHEIISLANVSICGDTELDPCRPSGAHSFPGRFLGRRRCFLFGTTTFGVEERPVALVNATKDSVDPQLGTILTERYENYIRDKDASSGLSVPEVEEYIAVDSSFTSIIDNEQAKEVLSTVVSVDFISCFAHMCSLRIPVNSLKDISRLDSFTSIIDNEQAKEVLSTVVSVDFISCFAHMCSLRIPVNSLKDISRLDLVWMSDCSQAKAILPWFPTMRAVNIPSMVVAFSLLYFPIPPTVWVGYRETFRRETCPAG
jgi:hypothetical protein